ncbi:MAG TPA: hypothetical protein VM325_13155 [Alphaproteobacteria bacterium]|nr:hypothetical protein [Alphaproteobacteria bacterium]
MKALKWVLAGAGGVIVVVGLLIWLIFAATEPAAEAANKFLDHVGNGRIEQAYKETAPLFRQRQALSAFRIAVRRFGMDRYKSASWNSREITGTRTLLKGTITLRDGARLPAHIGLVKIGDAWRVIGMTFPSGGVSGGGLPQLAESEALVMRSLLDFNTAVQSKDFGAFHAKLSSAMRKKFTAVQIQGVFHRFVAEGIDISPIKGTRPQFDPAPKLNNLGALEVKGRYPTRPSEVLFDLRYVKEDGQWRLITINVRVKPVS